MPRRPGDIRLVCFDLGGVIVRICRSWREGCAVAGLEVRADLDALCVGSESWVELHGAHQTGRIDASAWAEGLSALTGGRYSPHEVMRVHRGWTRDEYRGVGAVVDRIHAAGAETAVLSNTDAVHWAILAEYPAFTKLHNRLGSHLLEVRKPDPAAYRAIEARTGAKGREILFFDDLPENVEAARAIGWRAELVDPLAPTTAGQIASALERRGVLVPLPLSQNARSEYLRPRKRHRE